METVQPLAIGESRPTRARGLKSLPVSHQPAPPLVAPYAGAWIEINLVRRIQERVLVAPYAGAWIEMASRIMPIAP